MEIKISITKEDIKKALDDYIRKECGLELIMHDSSMYSLLIETRSKQNYRSEWEEAELRATLVTSVK